MMKFFHPYHSIDGRMWPELDDRVVTAPVMAAYEGCCREVIIMRAAQGFYGQPTKANGVWLDRAPGNPKGKGIWKFRPAMIWRLRAMGKFSDPDFHPRQINIPIYWCPMAETERRHFAAQAGPASPAPSAFDALITGLAAAVAAQLQPARTAGVSLGTLGDVIPFPRTAREN